jgi:hypothetical protein
MNSALNHLANGPGWEKSGHAENLYEEAKRLFDGTRVLLYTQDSIGRLLARV